MKNVIIEVQQRRINPIEKHDGFITCCASMIALLNSDGEVLPPCRTPFLILSISLEGKVPDGEVIRMTAESLLYIL